MDMSDRVARVIAHIQTSERVQGYGCHLQTGPQPMSHDKLAKLQAPGGGSVPQSLALWLAFDAQWFEMLDEQGGWRTTSCAAFVRRQMDEVVEELGDDDFDAEEAIEAILDSLPKRQRTAPAVELPSSASQAHLMVFEKRGTEPRIFGYENEELWVKYETFADFLEHYFGLTTL